MFKYIIALLLVSSMAFAGDPHHSHDPEPTTNTTNVTNIYNTENSIAMAGAVAHATQCDFGSFRPQGNVGLSNYKDSNAIAFGLCQRFKEVTGSFSITVLEGDSDPMVSAGIRWKF